MILFNFYDIDYRAGYKINNNNNKIKGENITSSNCLIIDMDNFKIITSLLIIKAC